MDDAIETALDKTPAEIRPELRNWIQTARAGEVAAVERSLAGSLDAGRTRFERALHEVEELLGA